MRKDNQSVTRFTARLYEPGQPVRTALRYKSTVQYYAAITQSGRDGGKIAGKLPEKNASSPLNSTSICRA